MQIELLILSQRLNTIYLYLSQYVRLHRQPVGIENRNQLQFLDTLRLSRYYFKELNFDRKSLEENGPVLERLVCPKHNAVDDPTRPESLGY